MIRYFDFINESIFNWQNTDLKVYSQAQAVDAINGAIDRMDHDINDVYQYISDIMMVYEDDGMDWRCDIVLGTTWLYAYYLDEYSKKRIPSFSVESSNRIVDGLSNNTEQLYYKLVYGYGLDGRQLDQVRPSMIESEHENIIESNAKIIKKLKRYQILDIKGEYYNGRWNKFDPLSQNPTSTKRCLYFRIK